MAFDHTMGGPRSQPDRISAGRKMAVSVRRIRPAITAGASGIAGRAGNSGIEKIKAHNEQSSGL